MHAYTRHPLSALWPDMPEDEKAALREDIKENGLRNPIVIHEKKVLDGWHRYGAALAVGAEIKTAKYKGDDPAGFVIAMNARRRHLSKKAVAKAVLATRNWREPGRPSKRDDQTPEAQKTRSSQEIASEAGVSVSTVEKAKSEMRGKQKGKKKKEPSASEKGLPPAPRPESSPAPEENPEAGVSSPVQLAAQRRLRDTLNENERLRGQVKQLTEEAAKRQDDADDKPPETSVLDQKQAEIESLRASVAEWQSKCKTLEQEKKNLRTQLDEARGQRDALEHALEKAVQKGKAKPKAAPKPKPATKKKQVTKKAPSRASKGSPMLGTA